MRDFVVVIDAFNKEPFAADRWCYGRAGQGSVRRGGKRVAQGDKEVVLSCSS